MVSVDDETKLIEKRCEFRREKEEVERLLNLSRLVERNSNENESSSKFDEEYIKNESCLPGLKIL